MKDENGREFVTRKADKYITVTSVILCAVVVSAAIGAEQCFMTRSDAETSHALRIESEKSLKANMGIISGKQDEIIKSQTRIAVSVGKLEAYNDGQKTAIEDLKDQQREIIHLLRGLP